MNGNTISNNTITNNNTNTAEYMKVDCCCGRAPHLDVENLDGKHWWCLLLDDQSAKCSTTMLTFCLWV